MATNEKHKRTANKPTSVPKNDLGKESVECVTNNATKAAVDNNPLLGFVDGTNLKTTGRLLLILCIQETWLLKVMRI